MRKPGPRACWFCYAPREDVVFLRGEIVPVCNYCRQRVFPVVRERMERYM